MKFLSGDNGYGHNIRIVQLSDAELALSDEELITLADNNGESCDDCCHFGGKVVRSFQNDLHRAKITIFTD